MEGTPTKVKRGFFAALALAFVLPAASASAAGVREEAVTVTIPVGTLSGTLMVPPGNGPFPVALIIAGSGPVDRDGNAGSMLHNDTYKKLAEGLAARGIATLRYDKRGIGRSTDAQSENGLRFNDYVNDALALTTYLERDPRFNSVSIIGHSEGSLVGIIAAQRDPHLRAFVSLEGPGRNFGLLINEQVHANPANPPEIVQEVESIDASLMAGKTVANVDPRLFGLFRPSIQPFLISEDQYDPAKEMASLTIPVLIIQGTTDVQVRATDAKLLAAADPKAQPATIAGMNHVLVDAPAEYMANIGTYVQILPLNAALVPTIAQFLKS